MCLVNYESFEFYQLLFIIQCQTNKNFYSFKDSNIQIIEKNNTQYITASLLIIDEQCLFKTMKILIIKHPS